MLSELVRRLDGAQLPILGLELRRPSLDDVFLNLTGRTASDEFDASTKPVSQSSRISPI